MELSGQKISLGFQVLGSVVQFLGSDPMTLSEMSVPGVCAGLAWGLAEAWPWGELGPLRTVDNYEFREGGPVASLPTSNCLMSPLCIPEALCSYAWHVITMGSSLILRLVHWELTC